MQAVLDVGLNLPLEDIKVKQRFDRAYDIVRMLGQAYELIEEVEGGYSLTRASTSLLEDNSATYLVSRNMCTCPDYPSARGNLCKHRMAVMLVEDMREE